MTTIQDYIDKNENIKVRIDRKESTDPCDPMSHTEWEGMLKDIPQKYRNLEVISEGWLMQAQINSLAVYIPPRESIRNKIAEKKEQVYKEHRDYKGATKCQEK